MSRRQARELALQTLFEIDIRNITPEEIRRDEGKHLEEEDFYQQIISGVFQARDRIDRLIEKYANEWKISRMAVVDRNILRMAIYEIFFLSDIPVNVSINEAVELAKAFSSEEGGKFINGILGEIVKSEKGNPLA